MPYIQVVTSKKLDKAQKRANQRKNGRAHQCPPRQIGRGPDDSNIFAVLLIPKNHRVGKLNKHLSGTFPMSFTSKGIPCLKGK